MSDHASIWAELADVDHELRHVTVSLAASKATDEAGNANAAAPANVTVISDRTPPTVKVFAPVDGVATIAFSEQVNGFDMADLRLFRNGAAVPLRPADIVKLALENGSDRSYTLSGLANAIAATPLAGRTNTVS